MNSEENSTESTINGIEINISINNETLSLNSNKNETLALVNNTVPLNAYNTTLGNLSTTLNSAEKWHRNKLKTVSIEVLQTNMLDNEVELCKSVVNSTVSHEYGSRKTSRLLKTELDQIFSEHKYRFSVVISSDVSYILSKSLFGLWVSMIANGKHYFLIASYKAAKAVKLTEAQLDRIEDWTSVYFITYENMTRQAQLDRVTKMVKEKLDLNYGKGNAWAVIAYRHSFAIKGKRLFDQTPHLQFKRLDGSLWFVFRGG